MNDSLKLLTELIGGLSPEKKTLLAAMLQIPVEPIAITGMGCRFPGKADSINAYWQMLNEGHDAISTAPANRWNSDNTRQMNDEMDVRMAARWGGFLDSVDGFDAAFFGIAPREAIYMDPQQRLLLEVAWEALENAGQAVDSLAGSATGVFVGVCTNDYLHFQLHADSHDCLDPYATSGTAHSIVANRLSYLLDLRGPSVAVDTACSSSLVALHLACQSLRNRECRMALAGGVNIMLSQEPGLAFSRLGMLAPDGRCKTFDAQANGYVRGEGCGVVVLKRLSEALTDGDPILALIRGTAINQDGHSNGLTSPNGQAQEAVIRQALCNAGVLPEQIGYVETHGTGTSLGDPIEIEALTTVLGQPRSNGNPCMLGSVKTNIGHLEAAAGIAGLIKAVLALHHGEIPPHLHFQTLNPNISLKNTPFIIPTKGISWPHGEETRFAGVSAFGFGGTNAHIVLEEAPQMSRGEQDDAARHYERANVLPISARTSEALHALVQHYSDFLLADKTLNLRDICYTASMRRSHHRHRLAFVASSIEELRYHLEAWLHDQKHFAAATKSEDEAQRILAEGGYSGLLESTTPASIPVLEPLHAQLEAIATLYMHGYTINWSLFYPVKGRCIPLPSYPWQRLRFWIESASTAHTDTTPANTIAQVDTTGEADVTDWIYQLRWQPEERDLYLTPRGYRAKAEPGNWLLLADASGVGQALSRRLQALGERCVLLYPGQSFERLAQDVYQLHPASREDYQRLLQETCNEHHSFSTIVHLWNLDIASGEKFVNSTIEEGASGALASCESVLHLLHALLREKLATSPRLWLVTRGAQPAEPCTALAVSQSPVWGMGRTVALEYANLWGGLIDLDPQSAAEKSAARLMEVLYGSDRNGAGNGEDQIAFRGDYRYVLRLLRRPRDTRQGNMQIRRDGTYLITGGLGAIGLKVASWLAGHGARHLVLLGRNGLPDPASSEQLAPDSDERRRVEVVRSLEAAGVQVRVVQADVSNLDQMAGVFEDIDSSSYPLRGILHAAGVSISQTIAMLDRASLQAVLRPKVQGSLVLHQLSRGLDIDFFVLFSSASAVWGSPQLAAYTAANLFLDGLSHERRAQGLPALSINWGLWADSGMVSQKIEQVIRKAGVLPMQGKPALDALEYLIGTNAVQAIIAEVDWQTFIPTVETGRKRPLLSYMSEGIAKQISSSSEQQSQLIGKLERASYSERQALLEEHIQAEVNSVMGFDESFSPDREQSLFDLGMDSLMALKLENRLERSLGRTFPATVPFDHPTITALAGCLNDLF